MLLILLAASVIINEIAWMGSEISANDEWSVGAGLPRSGGGETPPLQTKPIEDGPLQVYPAGVIFNEILPSPEGPDEAEEWIVPTNKPRTSASLPQLVSSQEKKLIKGLMCLYQNYQNHQSFLNKRGK